MIRVWLLPVVIVDSLALVDGLLVVIDLICDPVDVDWCSICRKYFYISDPAIIADPE